MNRPSSITAIDELRRDVEELRDEVAALNQSTKALVDAWNTANGLVKFIKFLATMLAAIGGIYFFFRSGVLPKVD